MCDLSEEKVKMIVLQLKAIEAISESLYDEVGSENTIELRERMKELKAVLNLPEWK